LAELSLCDMMYVLKDGKLETIDSWDSETELIARFR